jgi:hypothetical protein
MKSYHTLREYLADLEHQQWMSWAKSILQDEKISDSRQKRWLKLLKPYSKLTQEQKEQDREWADKVLEFIPIRCPVWQCGGLMVTKENKPPEDFIEGEHYNGDEQTPNLVCTNCRAVYRFTEFKK